MRNSIAVICLLVYSKLCLASPDYTAFIKQAENDYQAQAYDKSVASFQLAFKERADNRNDFYNAACAAALAGNQDLAFKWLNLAIAHGWTNIRHLKSDRDLLSLHEHKNWSELINTIQAKVDAAEKHYDKALQKELLAILETDQTDRQQIQAIQQKFGPDSKEVQALWQKINQTDRQNLEKIELIIRQRGWVGPDLVGEQASSVLFYVIQHADLATQERYFPIMRAAVQEKKAQASSLALLEDRIAIGNGRRQIYGSQVEANKSGTFSVFPIQNPEQVDQRRAAVGLAPLASYLKIWQISWDIDAHKRAAESDSRYK